MAYTKDIGLLKIEGVNIGYKPGVLSNLATAISNMGINIKSVITAQTCINIIVEKDDLEACYKLLKKMHPSAVDEIETKDDVALMAIVGEGMATTGGLAARVLTALAQENINLSMISYGASKVAFYLIVESQYLEKAIRAIHREFFKE